MTLGLCGLLNHCAYASPLVCLLIVYVSTVPFAFIRRPLVKSSSLFCLSNSLFIYPGLLITLMIRFVSAHLVDYLVYSDEISSHCSFTLLLKDHPLFVIEIEI